MGSEAVSRIAMSRQAAGRWFRSVVSLPSWGLSLVVHAILFLVLGTFTWTVHKAVEQRDFTVGIMVKKQTSQGEVFESKNETYSTSTAEPTEQDFIPEDNSADLDLPDLPDIDTNSIGLSGQSYIDQMDSISGATAAPGAVGSLASTQFFGAQVAGSKFVYVVDRSGSMAEYSALGAAKRELIRSLEQLTTSSEFQIIFYNHSSETMGGPRARMMKATPVNKQRVETFLDTISPDGGTDHVNALEKALKLRPDTVLFLSDAADMELEALDKVTIANRSNASIHTIEFGEGNRRYNQTLLRKLSENNAGSYHYVDVTQFGKAGL